MNIKIMDYDSNYIIDQQYQKLIIIKSGFLLQRMYELPVYLVNSNTMDKISPPEKMYDRNCARDILKGLEKSNENPEDRDRYNNIENIFEKLEGCRNLLFSAVGAYVKSDYIDRNEHILICPERIPGTKNQFKDVFLEVLFHELTHAYLNTPSHIYKHHYYRVIEESLCEAVAISRFSSEKELFNILTFTSDPNRPLEYTGYPFWSELFKISSVKAIVDALKYNKSYIFILPYVIYYYIFDEIIYHHTIQWFYHIIGDPHQEEILLKRLALEILKQS